MHSLCIVYASSMQNYARDTCRGSVIMRRNWFETAYVHVRPLTPHLHITHEPRMYQVHRGTKVLVHGTFAKHAFWMRFVRDNVSGVEYCTVFAHMRRRARYFSDSSVVVNDTCMVLRDSCIIRQ